MKFPESMLREMVGTSLIADKIGDLLTMAGFELEGIEDVEGEPVLDIKVVSNRGDGLSVLGLAREILAKDSAANPTELYRRSADRSNTPILQHSNTPEKLVSIDCPDCTRFACYTFEGVRNGESPAWMQKRIRQAGWRPNSLLVDVTNYVMLELGQPLHAYDLPKLRGERIVVRHARAGEVLITLNGDEHKLQAGQMMICDAERPVGAAGIMGGLETEVSSSTTRVLLESAHFVNTSVRRTRNQMGLSTEASYRFERSVDPNGVVAALDRVLELLRTLQPSLEVTGFSDLYPSPPSARTIEVSVSRASRLLGMDITVAEATGYLERLGFAVSPPLREGELQAVASLGSAGSMEGRQLGTPFNPPPRGEDRLVVTVPTWRPDVVREEDVVEELGRVHGYEKIPAILPQGTTTQGGVFGFEAFVDRIREECVRLGLQQIISHSLRDLHPLDAPGERIGPRNPNSPEMAYLRNSLLPGLAEAALRNGGKDVHLFEIGRVFVSGKEIVKLALLSQGDVQPTDWLDKAPSKADFFSLKGLLEAVCGSVTEWGVASPTFQADARLHPTRQAYVSPGDLVGRMGQVHPDVAEAADLPMDTVVAEINLDEFYKLAESGYRLVEVSRYPSVRRDLAILADRNTTFHEIAKVIHGAISDFLEKMWLFDVYEGKGIPEGKHSLGIALQLRKMDSTFTDEEANQVRERAVMAIESLGATTR